MRRVVTAGCAALALAMTGACADDADNDDVAAESGSAEEYCTMSAELDAADAPPSEEQLEEIVDVAPAEIKDDVQTLADAIREEDFEAEAAQEADRNLQEWEAEHCDRPADRATGGNGDGSGGDPGTDAENGEPGTEDPAGIREEDTGNGEPGPEEGPAGESPDAPESTEPTG